MNLAEMMNRTVFFTTNPQVYHILPVETNSMPFRGFKIMKEREPGQLFETGITHHSRAALREIVNTTLTRNDFDALVIG